MKPTLRRVLAIIALVLFVPFLVFFIMALGAFEIPGNLAPILASVFGLTILILFLLLKMDDTKRRRMSEAEEARLKESLGVSDEDAEEIGESTEEATESAEVTEEDPNAQQSELKD